MKIQRGIFQGDSLSWLLFVIEMIPLNYVLWKCRTYKFIKSQEKIYHFTYMRLPCSSFVEEFKITKTWELLQYTESEDPKVAAAGIQIRSDRKRSAKRELRVAEERLRHKAILGSIDKGRAVLGFFPSTHPNSAKGKERRQLIPEEVCEGVKEVRYGKMVDLSQQGTWTRWENVEKRRVTWSDCWRPDFSGIRFLIKSVYHVLPSPTNLHIWGKRETPNCQLCARKGYITLA